MAFYSELKRKKESGEKLLAVLIDPDKTTFLDGLFDLATDAGVDFFLVGGSLITEGNIDHTLQSIRQRSGKPVFIFPGDNSQISSAADGILLLSLISGRNPEYLIGQHVKAAPILRKSGLEILSTGYLLIESGNITTAQYMSHTLPIPHGKPEIAATTALAGEQLGMKLIYLDGGSGAGKTISQEMIASVAEQISIPLLVGGGIKTPEQAQTAWDAGADIVVIGTVLESDPTLLSAFKKRSLCN